MQAEERDKDPKPSAEPPASMESQQIPRSTPARKESKAEPTLPEEPTSPLSGDEEEPDWLADLRSAAKERELPETPVVLDADEKEASDWLSGVQPSEEKTPAKKTRPASSTGDAPEPDWLDTGPASEKEGDLETDLPSFGAEDEDSMDWLAELIPPHQETTTRATKPTPGPQEEQPDDWASGVDASSKETERRPETPPSEPQSTDTSEWFAEAKAPDVEEPPVPEAPISEAEQIPDWLREAQASIREAESETEEAQLALDAPETEAADQPATPQASASELEADTLAPPEEEGLEESADQYIPFPPSSIEGEREFEHSDRAEEDAELAEWLAELRPPVSELEPEPAEPPLEDESQEPEIAPAASDEELVEPEVPVWLADLEVEGPEEAPQEIEEAAIETEIAADSLPSKLAKDEAELEGADIPAWLLALKPRELRDEGEPSEPPSGLEGIDRETGLLSGIQGTLPIEMIVAQPRAVTAPRAVDAALTETDHSRLFGSIVSRAPEAAPRQVAHAPASKPSLLPRWILYLALIVVVSLPLLLPEPLVIRTIEPAPATTDLHSAIEALDSQAAVLVAFDYDPTTSGEMDLISQALVGHLMDRGARIIAMSLLPAGPATAQPLLDDLAAEHPDYAEAYGQRYVNLGYLPGQATAVRLVGLSPARAFSSDFRGTPLADLPIMDGLTNAEDFDLVLELAARQESVRWWIEQASMPYDVPLGAGVSAPVAPLAQPYYETDPRQLVGLLGGAPGAVTYEALRSSQDGPAQSLVARLDSQMAGQLLLVLVLLVGNGIFLVQRGARR
jgi:hypothetical protein